MMIDFENLISVNCPLSTCDSETPQLPAFHVVMQMCDDPNAEIEVVMPLSRATFTIEATPRRLVMAKQIMKLIDAFADECGING